MIYTIYQTTNLINNKTYIGKHKCNCNPCKYIGSGKMLKYAIKKYGEKQFKKEILFIFETEEEMNAKEAELVNEEFVTNSDTYNLCFGGNGGWSYVNLQNLNTSEKQKAAARISASKICHLGGKAGKGRNRTWQTKGFAGNKHTEETKLKMSVSISEKCRGENNSQFGSMWITNGSENRKVKKDVDVIPEGWYKGRMNTPK